MNLDRLALVAEIISSIAVVVTLIVVLVELRHNTAAIQAATYNEVANTIPMTLDYRGIDADVARIWNAGEAGQHLEPTDLSRYRSLVTANMRRFENAFYQYRIGGIEETQWQPIENVISGLMSSAGHRNWWSNASDNFSPEFRELVDRLMTANR